MTRSVDDAKALLDKIFQFKGSVYELDNGDIESGILGLEHAEARVGEVAKNNGFGGDAVAIATGMIHRELSYAYNSLGNESNGFVYQLKYHSMLSDYPQLSDEIGSQKPSTYGNARGGALGLRWETVEYW